jgi:hypothetical protein
MGVGPFRRCRNGCRVLYTGFEQVQKIAFDELAG